MPHPRQKRGPGQPRRRHPGQADPDQRGRGLDRDRLDGATAYVTSYADSWADGASHDRGGKVAPVDLAIGVPGKPILVAGSPAGIAITPDGATAYVTNGQGNGHNGTVTPINLATGISGKPIPVGDSPQAIAINPQGTAAYVVNMNGIKRDRAPPEALTAVRVSISTP
jgi:DNA-binding beta-propeller fold protein YncE